MNQITHPDAKSTREKYDQAYADYCMAQDDYLAAIDRAAAAEEAASSLAASSLADYCMAQDDYLAASATHQNAADELAYAEAEANQPTGDPIMKTQIYSPAMPTTPIRQARRRQRH